MIEQRKMEDAAKLAALRGAVRDGFEALERGEYKEFDSAGDLENYLIGRTEELIRAATPIKNKL